MDKVEFEIVDGVLKSVELNGNTHIYIPSSVTEIRYAAFREGR